MMANHNPQNPNNLVYCLFLIAAGLVIFTVFIIKSYL